MTRKLELIFLLALTLFIFTDSVQSQRTAPAPRKPLPSVGEVARSGQIDGPLYRNNFLGLQVSLPAGWDLVSDDASKAALNASKEKLVVGKSKEFEKAMDESIGNTRVLFLARAFDRATSRPLGTLACGIERTSNPLDRYTEFNKNIVLSANPNSRVVKDVYKRTLAGLAFSSFEIAIPKENETLKQIYLVTIRKGYMFFFVLSYFDEPGRQLMEASLETLAIYK